MPPDPFRGLGLDLLVASLLPLVSGQLGDWETTALCIHDSSCQLPYVTISTSFHLDANTRHTWIQRGHAGFPWVMLDSCGSRWIPVGHA